MYSNESGKKLTFTTLNMMAQNVQLMLEDSKQYSFTSTQLEDILEDEFCLDLMHLERHRYCILSHVYIQHPQNLVNHRASSDHSRPPDQLCSCRTRNYEA